MVAVGLGDGGVWIGHQDSLETVHFERKIHPEVVSGLSWDNESQCLISGSLSGSVCRTLVSKSLTERFHPIDGPIYRLATLGDRVFISTHVSEPLDRSIMELDSKCQIVRRSVPFAFHASGLTPLHRDNTIVAIGQDRTMRFMDSDSLETRVSFSEDEIFDKKIISSGDDSLLIASTRGG